MAAETQIYAYDLRRVVLSICGIPIRGGSGENDFVKFTPVGPMFTVKYGIHGDVAFSKQARNANFELVLQIGSKGAQKMNALMNADHLAPNGAGVGAILCEDLENGVVINGTCRLTEEPEYNFAKDSPEITYKGVIIGFKVVHTGAIQI